MLYRVQGDGEELPDDYKGTAEVVKQTYDSVAVQLDDL